MTVTDSYLSLLRSWNEFYQSVMCHTVMESRSRSHELHLLLKMKHWDSRHSYISDWISSAFGIASAPKHKWRSSVCFGAGCFTLPDVNSHRAATPAVYVRVERHYWEWWTQWFWPLINEGFGRRGQCCQNLWMWQQHWAEWVRVSSSAFTALAYIALWWPFSDSGATKQACIAWRKLKFI